MRMLLSILFLLSASLFRGTGQVREITGTVKYATGSLPGALVTVTTEADDHVLAYAVADAEGHFALKVAEAAQGSRFIHARMMGYTAQKVLLTPDRSEYAFVLAEASVMLKEVKVRATPISGAGDTTRYLASSFARENDITLADVIKRMPGFNISADGRIKYAGREISNFYIDGSDMMTGNYTTAIRSIKHEDVGRVEVIEHHQPIKLFEDLLFSDQTAVNVTLKERAKNRWVGVVEAGGGVPRLWQVDASAMRFAQKVKTMNTYKGNNTGRDVVGGGTSGGGSAREVIALPSADNPYLERSRTLFNRSHRLSLNNQWDMGRSFTLTPCMELFGAETESDAAETRRYYLDDGQTRELTTRQSGRRRLHGASPSVRLEANTRRMYLSNVLTSDIRRSSGHTDAVGTYSNVADGQVDGAYLRNDLYVLFRRGRRVVGIKSAIEWSRLPQRLDIRRAEAEMGERIGASAFRVQTSTSQMIGLGRAPSRSRRGSPTIRAPSKATSGGSSRPTRRATTSAIARPHSASPLRSTSASRPGNSGSPSRPTSATATTSTALPTAPTSTVGFIFRPRHPSSASSVATSRPRSAAHGKASPRISLRFSPRPSSRRIPICRPERRHTAVRR